MPRLRRDELRVAVVVWTLFGLACAGSALWGMRTHGHSPAKLAVYNLVVWNAWALGTLVVAALGRRWPLVPLSVRAIAQHVAAALVLGVVHHAWWTLMLVVLRPYDAMGPDAFGPAFANDLADRLFLEGTAYFAVLGVSYAVDSQRRLRERELRAAQLEASLAKAQLTALELQLQPHFLFNTLHAIGGLVRQRRSSEAIEMIAGLSDLLRYSLDHAGEHLVPLADELAVVRRYLAIQALRFSDRLAISIDVPEDLHRLRVPPLLLQPLVENAIRHGVERANDAATIAVRAHRDGDQLVVAVENTATGAMPAGEGVGIANTRARLHQLFADRHAFTLAGDHGRVTATIRLPAEAA